MSDSIKNWTISRDFNREIVQFLIELCTRRALNINPRIQFFTTTETLLSTQQTNSHPLILNSDFCSPPSAE